MDTAAWKRLEIVVIMALLTAFAGCRRSEQRPETGGEAPASRQPPAAEIAPPVMPLGQDVMAAVRGVRTWETFDGKLPALKPYQHWQCGPASFVVDSYGGARAPAARGRYWEVLVWLKNQGQRESRTGFLGKDGKSLDAALLDEASQTGVAAFRVPGVSSGLLVQKGSGHRAQPGMGDVPGLVEQSLFREFTGRLELVLKPGEESWLVLLFDVPATVTSARLRLGQAAPVAIALAAGKR